MDIPQTGVPASGTGDTSPAPQTPTPAPNDTSNNDSVTLKKSDHDNLVRQRDQANEALRQARESGSDSEAFVARLAQEKHIDGFLKDKTADYPDLTTEDLMHINDPDELEAEAARLQRRFEDVSQKKLQEVQVVGSAPRLSAEDKTAQLDELRKNPSKDSFERMVNIRNQ